MFYRIDESRYVIDGAPHYQSGTASSELAETDTRVEATSIKVIVCHHYIVLDNMHSIVEGANLC